MRQFFRSIKSLSRLYHNLTGGQVIYKKLLENNVKDVFGITGGAVMPLMDAFSERKINYYMNTHEQSAGHAATAYAKSTGCKKPGISIVTSGPGLTNSVTALTDATNDSTPLILFSGNVPLSAIGTNAFQECPSTEITKSITKWSYRVKSVEEIPQVIDEAFRISLKGKPGAVHIDLPKCIISETFDIKKQAEEIYWAIENDEVDLTKQKQYDNKKVSELIRNSARPVLLVGQGCNNYSEELRNFANNSNIPVTTTIHAMGVFDETSPRSLEFLGMHGNVAANYAIQNADLIIALGTRFDDRITGCIEKYAPEAFKAYKAGKGGIIHVNKNKKELGSVVASNYNFNMDCGDFLKGLTPMISLRKGWFSKINKWKKDYPFQFNKLKSELNTQEVLSAFNKYFIERKLDNYIVTTGVGNHQMMAAQFIKWRHPCSFISSGSLGVMGVGLPYAIGCQIANPDKLVIDIDGDGSFNQTLSELKTIQNYDLPIKIAIMNDNCYSMVRAWEKLFFDERYVATDLIKNPNYVKLAESYGIKAIRCNNRKFLDYHIEEFLTYPGPILCDFRVKSDLCLPLIPPGGALHEMIKFNDKIVLDKTLPPS